MKIGELEVLSFNTSKTMAVCRCSCGKEPVMRAVGTLEGCVRNTMRSQPKCKQCGKKSKFGGTRPELRAGS